MESVENQPVMATSASGGGGSDSQYDSLSFGSTSNLLVREPTNDPSSNSNMNGQEHVEENGSLSVQCSSEGQFREADSEEMAINQSSSHVDIEEVPSMSHEVIIDNGNPAQMSLDNSASTDFRGTNSSVTTDDVNLDGQCINTYEYCWRYLENLAQLVEQLKPVLIQMRIPNEDAVRLLVSPQIPFQPALKASLQRGLETLVDIFQVSAEVLVQAHQMENASPVGEQTNEIQERRIAAPAEANVVPLNTQLQISEAPRLASETVSQAVTSVVSTTTLSQLLSQARRIVSKLNLIELRITEQPQKYWKTRYISCLKKKCCPAIQGESGTQRQYIVIEWSRPIDCSAGNFFVRVQLQSHDGRPHPTKVLVPPKTTVKLGAVDGKKRKRGNVRPTLDDLVISDIYGFDKNTRSILCPVTSDEYEACKKNLKVIMFNLCKTSEEITNGEETDSEASEDEQQNASIQHDLNKLCKLSINLCRQTSENDLEDISNTVVTHFIEESKGNKPLAVDESHVTPRELCRCGNEQITVPLNTDSEKKGFVVRLDDQMLDASEIRGMSNKSISFSSRPGHDPLRKSLRVKVSKKSISKTINQNHDPYNGVDEDELLDVSLSYVDSSNNPHIHKSIKTPFSKQLDSSE